jgi:outer membrane receptor for ferrienterochelin and colicin
MPARPLARWVVAAFLGLWIAGRSNSLRADDLADEADLHFQIGAERYREGDYRGALEHFLASNRLVPNRNVSFNIAKSYEQLHRYPEAFRYYTQALEGETEPDVKHRVDAALDAIKPNVAIVRVETEPPGATLYIDRRDLGSRGGSPRTLGLAPGSYRILAELPGYEPAQSQAIEARLSEETVVKLALAPKLEGMTGRLVVDADERGALVEIDGQTRAFTPAVVTLPAGTHRVRLEMKGFRAVEQTAEIHPSAETKLDIVLTQADEVIAASRVTEAVEDAPSSVSIVRSEELRGMAYPTIAEALRGTRGVYVSDDRSYETLGFRGLGRLGDFGNRVLVLLDGHPTNDDWIGSSYVGYDARTDLEDIDRIEVARGPGSVLYGTNAFSGVVNLVSRGVSAPLTTEVGAGTSDYGVGRGRARVGFRFGDGGTFWASAAAAKASGRDFYFPEYAGDPSLGQARDIDGFTSGTTSGAVTYGTFTGSWFLHSRSKQVPTGEFTTIFGDGGFRQTDTRGFVELKLEPRLSDEVQLLSRVYFDSYTFRGEYPRVPGDGGLERDTFDGAWAGAEERVVITPGTGIRLTLGGEVQSHFLVHQTAADDSGSYLDDRKPHHVEAAYLLADLPLGRSVRLSAGSRLDHYSTFGSSNNPRVGLIVRPYDGGNLKILAGKAFRAPSVYELGYNDGGVTQRASPGLRPEAIYSAEVEFSHRVSSTVTATIAAYGNLAEDLIVTRGASIPADPLHYENSNAPVLAVGGEAEIRRDFKQGWSVAASYSIEHSRYLPSASIGDVFGFADHPAYRHVPNAPEHLASLRAAAPILSRMLLASTRMSIEGPRFDRHDEVIDPIAQGRTEGAVIWDFVLSGEDARFGLRYAVGVYNVFDWRYAVPVGNEFRQNTIVQNGRTFLTSASVGF